METGPRLWQRLGVLVFLAALHWLSKQVVFATAIAYPYYLNNIISIYPEPWDLILKGLWVAAGIAAVALVLGSKRPWIWWALPLLIVFGDLVLNVVAAFFSFLGGQG